MAQELLEVAIQITVLVEEMESFSTEAVIVTKFIVFPKIDDRL